MSFGKRGAERGQRTAAPEHGSPAAPPLLWGQLRRIFGGVAIGLAVWFGVHVFLMPQVGRSVAQRFEEHPAQRVVKSASTAAEGAITRHCLTPQFGAGLTPRFSDPLTGEQQHIFAEGDSVRRVAAHIVCQMSNERDRFCRPEARSDLVGQVKGYLALRRSGLRTVARYTNMAPAQLEAIYQEASRQPEHETHRNPNDPRVVAAVVALVAVDKDLVVSLRRLIEDGYISTTDFAGFLGMFMPTELEPLLAGLEVKGRPCS